MNLAKARPGRTGALVKSPELIADCVAEVTGPPA